MLSAAFQSAAEARRCHCAAQDIVGSALKTATARGIDCAMPVGLSADLSALPNRLSGPPAGQTAGTGFEAPLVIPFPPRGASLR